MALERNRLVRNALFAGMALLLAVVALAKPRKDEVFLDQLATALAGSYDNLAQSRTDTEHPALRLMIAPVQAPLVGDHVFYVQEMAADDLRRVLAQRLYVLNVIPRKEQAVLTQLDFNEPLRWRDGHRNRDLFRSLLVQDLRARPGCDLLWQRDGDGFKATLMNDACRASSRATGETVRVTQRMQLGTETLNLFEQHRDAAGVIVYGAAADPWYRFVRRADAPW